MPAPASKMEEWLKVAGDNLVLSVAQRTFRETSVLLFHLGVIISEFSPDDSSNP